MTFTIDIAVTKEMPMCVYVTAEFPQQLLLLLSLTRIAVDFHLVRGSKVVTSVAEGMLQTFTKLQQLFWFHR